MLIFLTYFSNLAYQFSHFTGVIRYFWHWDASEIFCSTRGRLFTFLKSKRGYFIYQVILIFPVVLSIHPDSFDEICCDLSAVGLDVIG